MQYTPYIAEEKRLQIWTAQKSPLVFVLADVSCPRELEAPSKREEKNSCPIFQSTQIAVLAQLVKLEFGSD